MIYKEAARDQAPRPADNLTDIMLEKVPSPVPGYTGRYKLLKAMDKFITYSPIDSIDLLTSDLICRVLCEASGLYLSSWIDLKSINY